MASLAWVVLWWYVSEGSQVPPGGDRGQGVVHPAPVALEQVGGLEHRARGYQAAHAADRGLVVDQEQVLVRGQPLAGLQERKKE